MGRFSGNCLYEHTTIPPLQQQSRGLMFPVITGRTVYSHPNNTRTPPSTSLNSKLLISEEAKAGPNVKPKAPNSKQPRPSTGPRKKARWAAGEATTGKTRLATRAQVTVLAAVGVTHTPSHPRAARTPVSTPTPSGLDS